MNISAATHDPDLETPEDEEDREDEAAARAAARLERQIDAYDDARRLDTGRG